MIKQDRLLWSIVGILLIAVVALLSYMQFIQKKQQIIEQAEINSECGLSQFPCVVKLKDGGSVQLDISPQPVEVLKPINIRIVLNNIDVNRVVGQFNGVGMNMGINRYIFKQKQDGSYHATVTLPVCVRNRMEWDAQISLETEQGVIIAPFRFEAFRQ
ncbi:MAG: hypothetical protein OEL79_02660 [Chromatiales bacterium]|nr:hypothetical protein [Chromatiales bacterium]